MFIKPKQGFKIPVPGRKFFLSEDGEDMPPNTYWKRLLLSGDVEAVQPSAPLKEFKEVKPKSDKSEKLKG